MKEKTLWRRLPWFERSFAIELRNLTQRRTSQLHRRFIVFAQKHVLLDFIGNLGMALRRCGLRGMVINDSRTNRGDAGLRFNTLNASSSVNKLTTKRGTTSAGVVIAVPGRNRFDIGCHV